MFFCNGSDRNISAFAHQKACIKVTESATAGSVDTSEPILWLGPIKTYFRQQGGDQQGGAAVAYGAPHRRSQCLPARTSAPHSHTKMGECAGWDCGPHIVIQVPGSLTPGLRFAHVQLTDISGKMWVQSGHSFAIKYSVAP